MEPTELDRQMDELIEAVAAIEDYLYRHPFSGSLGEAVAAFADPEGAGIDPETDREAQFMFTAIAIAPTLQELRVGNPGEFAQFIGAAASRHPGPAFDHAAAVILRSHIDEFSTAIRTGDQRLVDWSHIADFFDLAAAAEHLGDEAQGAAIDLHNLAAFAEGGVAREYVAAIDVGLIAHPGPDSYRLSSTHRNVDGETLQALWGDVFRTIDACPTTEAGIALRSFLLDRARKHLGFALQDFGALRSDLDAGFALHHQLSNDIARVYSAVNLELSARIARNGPRLPDGTIISMN